ncbi:MAG: ankyrin repeat domain-containing protein [Acidobacteria bacterium]|nr:ankyrin repeat domain-containing protein [Acidobacteriota bacterium]
MRERILNILPRRLAALALAFALANSAASAGPDLRLVDALQKQDRATALNLLRQGVDVNATQADGSTALAWAAHWDDAEITDQLIAKGAKLDAANENGVTALALACSNGSEPMAQRLLQAGASPNAKLWSGETPLMICARSGLLKPVQTMLSRGGNANHREERRGQTALMWAVAAGHAEVAAALVAAGAEVNTASHAIAGAPPLKHKTYYWDVSVAIDDTGADSTNRPNVSGTHPDPYSSKGGFTPLMFAAQQGNLRTSELLVKAGADVNASAPDGTPLIIATASGHDEVARFLIEHGARPNEVDSYGVSALHYAIWEGFLSIGDGRPLPTDVTWFRPNLPGVVQALLAHGADSNIRVTTGFPPYDFPQLRRIGNFQIPQLNHAGITPFLLASASADVSIMRMLLAAGADPKLTTAERATPLMVAAGLGRVSDRGAKKSAEALDAVKLLLELGSDVNARESGGRTALQGAAYCGEDEIIRLLAARGADVNAMDNYGRTALLIAAGDPKRLIGIFNKRWIQVPRPHASTAELLLKLGATPVDKLKIERRTQAAAGWSSADQSATK